MLKINRLREKIIDCAVVAALFCLILPSSLDSVIKQIGLDPHPVSFFIGPASYLYCNGLIPGVDYMT